jgi:hypothetical protein
VDGVPGATVADVKLTPPKGTNWTPRDLEIGDAFIFKPKGKTYSLGGVLENIVPGLRRNMLAVRQVRQEGFSDPEHVNKTLFYDDEIEVVARYSDPADVERFAELYGF